MYSNSNWNRNSRYKARRLLKKKLLSQKRKEKKRKGKEKIQMYKHWARPVDILAVNFNSQQESLLLYWLISVSSIYIVFDLISSCNDTQRKRSIGPLFGRALWRVQTFWKSNISCKRNYQNCLDWDFLWRKLSNCLRGDVFFCLGKFYSYYKIYAICFVLINL